MTETNEQDSAAMDTGNEVLCLACAATTFKYGIVRLLEQGEPQEFLVAITLRKKRMK